MTRDDFQDLLDTHGGDPDAWPTHLRDQALALLANSEEAQELHQEALAMDVLLRGDAAPQPSARALDDLFEDVARQAEAEANRAPQSALVTENPQPSWAARLGDFIFRPAYAVGFSSVLGLMAGFWDFWLEPTDNALFMAEFVYSALPL